MEYYVGITFSVPVHVAECHVVHFREQQQLPLERFKDLLPPTLVQTRRRMHIPTFHSLHASCMSIIVI